MWFYIALLTSIVGAVEVIVTKKLVKGVSASILTWATLVLATPIIFLFALKGGIPQLNNLFFIGVTGSVLFYTASQIIGFRAMRMANLSAVYPLASLGSIFTLFIASLPPLSERPSPLAILGVFITLAGVYILNVTKAKEGLLIPIASLLKDRASLLMIASVLLGGVVIIFDKFAINNTLPKNTTFTLLIENLMVILGMLPMLYIRDKNFYHQITSNSKLFLLLGLLNAIATILGFLAVGGGDVGLVSTIFKTQILFVLLFSYITFKDRPKLETIIGGTIMILGAVLIKTGS